MTPNATFDTPGKRAVRESWNSPILRFLNEEHGLRFRYMGLPGVDLLDVKLWQDMIEEVVAFEIPARATPNDPDGRRNIRQLRRNLQFLGVPSRAFYGPLEEVVILRRDYEGNAYQQNKVVTLYNLDFCDEIASRIETKERGEQLWRFQAIRQILHDQHEAFQRTQRPSYFMVLLTIRDQIDGGKLRRFLAENLYDDTQDYVQTCGGIEEVPPQGPLFGTHTWALKAFVHNILRQYLSNPNISATFFPVVRYKGTPIHKGGRRKLESPMLHFMLMCRFGDIQSPSPSYEPEGFLSGISSISVTQNGSLTWDPQPGEPSSPVGSPSASQILQEYGTPPFGHWS